MNSLRLRAARVAVPVALLLFAACGTRKPIRPSPTPPPSRATVGIMGASRLTGAQLATWFASRVPQPPGGYAAAVPVQVLAQIFVEEGAAEGVAGDVAFMQTIVETGWLRFRGSVPASFNNFAGIGATDARPSPAVFPDARTGVRAQIQHLRAYADPRAVSCTMPPLHNPCADPRFTLVAPKGRAATWDQMGNGNWATDPRYGASILSLYNEALAYHGLR